MGPGEPRLDKSYHDESEHQLVQRDPGFFADALKSDCIGYNESELF